MDIAVVVNLRARRGSETVARAFRSALPRARVVASRSLDEALDFAAGLRDAPPDLVVCAGGDGTAVSVLNALHTPGKGSFLDGPALGVLPLGTGNGWANATGAPRWRRAVEQLAALAGSAGLPPIRSYQLVEVGGIHAPFAGTGWDAELIQDFHAQKTGFGLLPQSRRNGLAGYLHGMMTRTVPRHLSRREPVEVELQNLGSPALTVDEEGRVVPLPGGEPGAILYRGPVNVCAAGTTPEWGFRFRAFPFARAAARRFNFRLYGGSIVEALARAPRLWRGAHPLPKMHSWLLDRCRVRFNRPVPFQIAGDPLGERQEIEYALTPSAIDVLDWRALRRR